MTPQPTHTKKAKPAHWGSFCLVFLLVFSLALLLRRADVAADCMRQGLSLCARTVVPSLFPFMVLSELLVTSNTGEWLISPVAHPLGKLLNLSRAGCCAVVLGLLCGFPVGARCAILAYEKGTIGRAECERALACSSIPSSAFLIGTIGEVLWNDAKFGTLLYITAIFSALLSGILIHVLQKRDKKEGQKTISTTPAKIHFDRGMFPKSIRNATMNTLLICAYVVFFCTLTGGIELILGQFGTNETTHAILSGILELSGGVSAVARLGNRPLAVFLTGATVGWSGLSIHCQMLSLCDRHDLSTRSYFTAKIMQTLLCPLMIAVLKRW